MRASRLVSVLLLLQARGRLTAAALAQELEVSERTIYRDLADLSAAGVPVYAERGEGGGYQLLGGYRTDLTGLSAEEAGMLLLTGLPAPAAQLGLGGLLAATRLKLLAALPADMREIATRAEQRFLLDPTSWAHARSPDYQHLETLAQAVWQDRLVRISHQRGDAPAVRVVSALGLVHKTGSWYLVASHSGSVLVYRVDRVRDASLVDAAAHRPPDFQLAEFWSRWEHEYAAGLPTFSVTVRLGPLAQRYRDALGAASPRSAVAEAPGADGWSHQTLVFDSQRVALSALLALAPEVEVIEPPELRVQMAALARQVIARMEPDPPTVTTLFP